MTHNIIIRHLVFPCIPGRGRRPRRPAFRLRPRWRPRWRPRVRGAPWTSRPTIITWSASCGTLCSRVSLITWSASCGTLCSRVSLVGADVPGGPRPRWRLRWRPRVRGAPGTSRPTIITWSASCGTLCSRVSLITWLASCGTFVFPCVPGRGRRPRRPASRWRLRWRPRVRGAPGRRALP